MRWHIGECKDVMIGYLSCIKKSKGMNDEECRNLAKSYLGCRMDRSATHWVPGFGQSVNIDAGISWRRMSLRIWALERTK